MGRAPGSRNREGARAPRIVYKGLTFRNCGLGACGRWLGRAAGSQTGTQPHPARPSWSSPGSPHSHTSGPGPKGSVTSQDVPRRWRHYTPEPLRRGPLGWGQERKLGPRSSIQSCAVREKWGAQGSWKASQEEAGPGGNAQWGSRYQWELETPGKAGKLRTDRHEALGLPRNERGMGGSSVGKLGKRCQEKPQQVEGGVSFRALRPAGRA